MPASKITKRPISSREVPSASGSFGLFAPLVSFVRLPFVVLEVFPEVLARFIGRGGATAAKKPVREMPTRKSIKMKAKAA